MNPAELQKNIALYYSKLTPKLQEVFSSMQWLETLKIVGSKYALSDEQKETLGTETTLVLLGITHPDIYEEILRKELKLPQSVLNNIIREIQLSILNDIQPELIETFHKNNESVAEQNEKLDERFGKLPKEIQEDIVASNYHAVLYNIAESQKLTVEQMNILEKLTTNTILGVIPPEKFENSLKAELKLTEDKTKMIVNSVNEQILSKIRMRVITPPVEKSAGITPDNTHINEDEIKILHEAGIKINPPDLSKPELTTPLTPVQPSIVADKLSESFKASTTKTEHVLDKLSKPAPTNPPPTSYPPKADPYRMSPDE